MTRLSRTALYLLSLTAIVLALTGGPVPSALSADYAKRQAERTKSKQTEQSKRAPSSDERVISSFMAPTFAKPADHDTSAQGPILANELTCQSDVAYICNEVSIGIVSVQVQLHLPAYRAHAPPIR